MARIKRTQIHASIDPDAYEILDSYHWTHHIELNILFREILENFADEISKQEPTLPED